MNTARALIADAAKRLAAAGCDAPRLDAELLLMHAWQLTRTQLIVRALDVVPEGVREVFEVLMNRRLQREPLAYLTGMREFWSRDFAVTSDVLIPRPETEHLIEAVIEHCADPNGNYLFCDIGTGSGCIAVTLACEFPNARVVASDISEAALAVAAANAARHGVDERIDFRHADMLAALNAGERFDVLISNPPYVTLAEMDGLERELSFEPAGALTDGGDGLRFLAGLLNGAAEHLKPEGGLVVETGSCGLPEVPATMVLVREIRDLARLLRGAIYRRI